jgi:hypothetical protein
MSSASNVVVGVGCVKLLELMRDPVTTTSVNALVVVDVESAALAELADMAASTKTHALPIDNFQLKLSIYFPLSLRPFYWDLSISNCVSVINAAGESALSTCICHTYLPPRIDKALLRGLGECQRCIGRGVVKRLNLSQRIPETEQ